MAIMGAKCFDGIARAWRHLRRASVPTPNVRAAASGPPNRSMMASTVWVMVEIIWEFFSQDNRRDRKWEISSRVYVAAAKACMLVS